MGFLGLGFCLLDDEREGDDGVSGLDGSVDDIGSEEVADPFAGGSEAGLGSADSDGLEEDAFGEGAGAVFLDEDEVAGFGDGGDAADDFASGSFGFGVGIGLGAGEVFDDSAGGEAEEEEREELFHGEMKSRDSFRRRRRPPGRFCDGGPWGSRRGRSRSMRSAERSGIFASLRK